MFPPPKQRGTRELSRRQVASSLKLPDEKQQLVSLFTVKQPPSVGWQVIPPSGRIIWGLPQIVPGIRHEPPLLHFTVAPPEPEQDTVPPGVPRPPQHWRSLVQLSPA